MTRNPNTSIADLRAHPNRRKAPTAGSLAAAAFALAVSFIARKLYR
ncbi:hypothetical protein [Gordonibacter sp. An230]|nr:hypothetical protein [Gordonibacter sp. An230]